MAKPSVTTVTIDGNKFNAYTANLTMSTTADMGGMPGMGTLNCAVQVSVDMHDNQNMPFATLKKLYDLARVVTRDKVREMKLEFWQDESQQDALCVYDFNGWISQWATGSGADGSNHILTLTLQPALDTQNFADLRMSN